MTNGGQGGTVLEMSLPAHHRSSRTGLISPKQRSSRSQRDWYPYYAGFTEEFVGAVIAEHLCDAKFILDPWSGSGTTTAACVKRGLEAKGIDINPALTVIARARLTPLSAQATLLPIASQIVDVAAGLDSNPYPTDLLARWMRTDAVRKIRALQHAIHLVLSERELELDPRITAATTDTLPVFACFFYSALFATVRDLLRRFRSTNPTWLKNPNSYRHRIAPSWRRLSRIFLECIDFLGRRLSLSDKLPGGGDSPFETGSATDLPFEKGLFDGALTSPPYATRIDYVTSTLPELAVLGVDHTFVSRLRRETTGSPVVRGVPHAAVRPLKSGFGNRVLEHIDSHTSKGSRNYYLPWLRNYFMGLEAGLHELSRTVARHGTICIVVQDSYYKGFLIDLQRIVTEMMSSLGRPCTHRHDYAAPNPRSRANTDGARGGTRQGNTETLLVFGKMATQSSNPTNHDSE